MTENRRNEQRLRRERYKQENLAKAAAGDIPIGTARCGKCKQSLPVKFFSRAMHRKNGLQAHCKECSRKSNPYQLRVVRFREQRKKFNAILERLKSGPCSDCGKCFPVVCMDFDHRHPGEKSHNIARMVQSSEEALMREVAKCDLVCANCHRVREQIRRLSGSGNRAGVHTAR